MAENSSNNSPGNEEVTAQNQTDYTNHVETNLKRNFIVHVCHGLLGQTGFRLLNTPTFLPAYILLLSGSNLIVSLAEALKNLGMALTPLIGANFIIHKKKVLPAGFLIGGGMRLSVLGIALTGLFFPDGWILPGILFFLLVFGIFMGMQGVIFNILMSKVIPIRLRGRLTGYRNFLAGLTTAVVAWLAGKYFIGEEPQISGYSYTFLLSFVLTSVGLSFLLFIREPNSLQVRVPSTLRQQLKDIPRLIQADQGFTNYLYAKSIATAGRLALPFYILLLSNQFEITGEFLGKFSFAFLFAGTVSNLIWGRLADSYGFKVVITGSLGVWIIAGLTIAQAQNEWALLLAYGCIGAAFQGFLQGGNNITLEFGNQQDLPIKIALSNSTSELVSLVTVVAAGIYLSFGNSYESVIYFSVVCHIIGLISFVWFVPEPRLQKRP